MMSVICLFQYPFSLAPHWQLKYRSLMASVCSLIHLQNDSLCIKINLCIICCLTMHPRQDCILRSLCPASSCDSSQPVISLVSYASLLPLITMNQIPHTLSFCSSLICIHIHDQGKFVSCLGWFIWKVKIIKCTRAYSHKDKSDISPAYQGRTLHTQLQKE